MKQAQFTHGIPRIEQQAKILTGCILEVFDATALPLLEASLTNKLLALYDTFEAYHIDFERLALSMPPSGFMLLQLKQDIARAAYSFSECCLAILGDDEEQWDHAKSLLHNHPLYTEFLSQSVPRETAPVESDFQGGLEIPHHNRKCGLSIYALLMGQFYQSLPAVRAMRNSNSGMERILLQLPEGARVLCLAQSTADELQQVARDNGLNFQIDFFGTYQNTISALTAGVWQTVIKPSTYDLIFTKDLFNTIATLPMDPKRGATGLTVTLFSFLKPGGQLIIGNLMQPGGENPHQASHQFIMEVYGTNHLRHRTARSLQDFASTLPPHFFNSRLLDETLAQPLGPQSIIGFLVIERLL
jgi:hypothetical protein